MKKECGENCSHYDSLNRCCWLITEKGIMVRVSEGDCCHHGIEEESEDEEYDGAEYGN